MPKDTISAPHLAGNLYRRPFASHGAWLRRPRRAGQELSRPHLKDVFESRLVDYDLLENVRGDLDPLYADFLLLGVVHTINDYQKPVVVAGQILGGLRLFIPDDL